MIRVAFIVFSIFSSSVYAAFYNPEDARDLDVSMKKFTVDDIPGESIDIMSGQLSWTETEFTIKTPTGDEFPVQRLYADGVTGVKHFENWELGLPRIIINADPNGKVAVDYNGGNICKNPLPKSFYGFKAGSLDWGTRPASDFYQPLKLHVPGEGSRQLARKDAELEGFPESAVWVSSDNWFAECASDGAFLVYSPSGKKYTIDVQERRGDYWIHGAANAQSHIAFYASEIENKFGEKIVFDYESLVIDKEAALGAFGSTFRPYVRNKVVTPRKPFLMAIRVVHKDSPNEGKVYAEFSYQMNGWYPKIDEIRSFEYQSYGGGFGEEGYDSKYWGIPRENTYNYEYHSSAIASQYCHFIPWPELKEDCDNYRHFISGSLRSARYPNGKLTSYHYGGPRSGSKFDGVAVGGIYTALTRVIHKSGLDINYTYQKINGSIINQKGHKNYPSGTYHEVLRKKTVKDGSDYVALMHEGGGVEYVTTYSFANDAGRSRTIVDKGDVKETYWFSRDKSKFYGSMLEKKVELDSDSVVEKYEYSSAKMYGRSYALTSKDNYSRYKPLLSKSEKNGFSKTYSNHDIYGFAKNIVEDGFNGSEAISRTKEYRYFHPYIEYGKAFVIGLVSEELISGETIKSNVFNWQGLPIEVYENGERESYSYYAQPEIYNKTLGESNWSLAKPVISDVLSNTSGQLAEKRWVNNESRTARFLGSKAGNFEGVKWDGGPEVLHYRTTLGTLVAKKSETGSILRVRRDVINRPTALYYSTSGSNDSYQPYDITYNYQDSWNLLIVNQGGVTRRLYRSSFGDVRLDETILGSGLMNTVSIYNKYDRRGNLVFESRSDFGSPFMRKGRAYTYDVNKRITKVADQTTGLVKYYCFSGASQNCDSGHGLLAGEFSMSEWDSEGRYAKHKLRGYEYEHTKHPSESSYLISEGDNLKVNYEYDALLRLLNISNNDAEHSFTYYPGGKVKDITSPSSGLVTIDYYDSGEIKSKAFGGRLEEFQYSSMGDVSRVSVDGDVLIEKEYYPNGFTEKSVNHLYGVQKDFFYGGYGELRREVLTVGNESLPASYKYNGNRKVSEITYPSGKVVEFLYDTVGRLRSIPGFASSAEDFTPLGHARKIVLNNGFEIVRDFDSSFRLNESAVVDADGNSILDLSLSYTPSGLIEGIDDNLISTNSFDFDYDYANRLIEASRLGFDESYFYDDSGNIEKILVGNTVDTIFNRSNGVLKSFDKNGVNYPVSMDNYGNVDSYNGNQFDFSKLGELDRHATSSLVMNYGYDASNALAYAAADGAEPDIIFKSSVLKNKIYEKSGASGIEKSYIYFEDQLLAINEMIPDIDADGDGVPDAIEIELGIDMTSTSDTDGDGLSDLEEISLGTLPLSADSDGDGVMDGQEVAIGSNVYRPDAYEDADGDGVINLDEEIVGGLLSPSVLSSVIGELLL